MAAQYIFIVVCHQGKRRSVRSGQFRKSLEEADGNHDNLPLYQTGKIRRYLQAGGSPVGRQAGSDSESCRMDAPGNRQSGQRETAGFFAKPLSEDAKNDASLRH